MSAGAPEESRDKSAAAPRRRNGLSRAMRTSLAVVGSILAAAPADATGLGRWEPLGPFGATVLSLAVMPAAPHTLYAGTANGLFKSAGGDAGGALQFEPLGILGGVI
ncbi:MAG: hypothetical protein JOZ15_13045, partial [Acidobacteria bacterium]|nr:hypothetical protein [Acidobacteriota bacterium]